jgi:hypothetical protein
MKGKSLLEPILKKPFDYSLGATPIGSAGRAPDEFLVSKNNNEGKRSFVY